MSDQQTPTGMNALTIRLQDEMFALEATHVREILDPVPITRVPNAGDFVGGLINVRGSVVPLADLRVSFGMERPPATVEDVSASKRPCLNPASKRPYERPSLTDVNGAAPEDDAELICRPKKSPAKRQRVTP